MNNREYLEKEYGKAFIDVVKSYLDSLRESGVTNMFGATPYIEKEFDVSKSDSVKFLRLWMDEFGK